MMNINAFPPMGRISDLVFVKPTVKHEYTCAYCQQSIKTWEVGLDGALVSLPSGPLITDGDTIFGIYDTLKLTESDPCFYFLESACICPHCNEQGFFVSLTNMSRKYDLRNSAIESRLLFNNINYGTGELFKANFIQFPHTLSQKLKLWRHYMSPSEGGWHIVEYKSAELPPMLAHRFGPFRCEIESIYGSNGVSACEAGHSWEWQLAAEIIIELWSVFWAIAEERQWIWENNALMKG